MKAKLFRNEKNFFYIELVAGSHDHIKTKVWVNKSFVPHSPEEIPPDAGKQWTPWDLEFPIHGAQVVKTEKGALVLRPAEGWVALVKERSGYRGSADFSLEGDFEIVAEGKEFHSPQGNLGETAWALVNVKSPELVVHASISGRRVSQGEYSYKSFPDGKIENMEEEGLEQLLE